MNNLSLQTKIEIDFDGWTYNYLNLNNGSFLIYTTNEIIIFYKNLSFKKLFLSNNGEEDNIKFIKNINNEELLCLNNNKLYIFNIKSIIKISKIIKFENNQNVLDVIGLKNGMILAITNNDILHIKINNNREEIIQISKLPKECIINKIKNHEFDLLINIYELPNNNILISSESSGTYCQKSGCSRIKRSYNKDKQFIFNIDKCKIIHFFQKEENGNQFSCCSNFGKLKIIINNKYICISKNKIIFIYNISNYELIRQINIHDYMLLNFDENMIFIINKNHYEEDENIILYDLTDLNKIKYQLFYFDKIISDKDYMINVIDIKKLSNRKMIVIYNNNLFIIKFTKQFKLLPNNDFNYYYKNN